MGIFDWFLSAKTRKSKIEDYIAQAEVSMMRHSYDEAFAATEKALDLDKHCIDALYVRGLCLLHRKEYESALADMDRALTLDPKYCPAIVEKAKQFGYSEIYDNEVDMLIQKHYEGY